MRARRTPALVLPSIAVWLAVVFGRGRLGDRRSVGLAAGAVALGSVLQVAMIWSYGGRLSVGHGNFAHPLYRLSKGAPDQVAFREKRAALGHRTCGEVLRQRDASITSTGKRRAIAAASCSSVRQK
jgi:hypothetical protein